MTECSAYRLLEVPHEGSPYAPSQEATHASAMKSAINTETQTISDTSVGRAEWPELYQLAEQANLFAVEKFSRLRASLEAMPVSDYRYDC